MIFLRVTRRPDGAEPVPDKHPIAANGSTIGRAPECDLVLDDPLRLVSRRHAWLAPHGVDAALLRCISSGAALQVNGSALAPGAQCVVHHGDCLRIGGFEVLVEASPAEPSVAPRRESRLGRWFDVDTAPDPLGPASPLPSLDGAAAIDPARATASTDLATRALDPPAPPARAAAPDAPSARAAVDPGPQDEGLHALQRAFLRGAGLDETSTLRLDPASMAHLGALLRTMTEGTLALLRSRAVAKRGIRAEGTQIAARQNNPLKFAPDAAQAMTLLMSAQPQRGFLDPLAALHDAHRDIQVHQLAMVAGMRAAVLDLISRLGPQAIEAAQGPPRGWVQRIPALRDAALWRRHKEQHARLMAHLDDTLEATFGREFLLAYEAQSKLGAAAGSNGDRDAPG